MNNVKMRTRAITLILGHDKMQSGQLAVDDLLIEFLVEELPPINLEQVFGETFASTLVTEIKSFVSANSKIEYFVTPRRFGVIFTAINSVEAEQKILKKGPAINTSLENNQPTKALLGFMKGCNVTNWQDLEQRDDGYFYFTITKTGQKLAQVLPSAIQATLKKLPIAKNMRWGDNDFTFVRPVHNLLILHGDKLICDDNQIFGLTPVNYTFGHRVMSDGKITVTNPGTYLAQMEDIGKVVASFASRRQLIADELNNTAKKLDLNLIVEDRNELLNEVTAIVEYPVVLSGEFNHGFLEVPQECLILSMAKNQKYFALLDVHGKLSNKFLFVANIASSRPSVIVAGNQKVLAARLADAKFFYDTDKKHDLSYFLNKLNMVVYHNKLGSQGERIKRLQNIACAIAPMLNVNTTDADLAVSWLKADLMTEMVGEFPELQGVMGKYYALNQGVAPTIADAIEKHYYPRFSGDKLPDTSLSIVVALADKLESLVGIWGIGLIPTGEKDPFALRRAALGIVRILLATDLDVLQLLELTFAQFANIDSFNQKADVEVDGKSSSHVVQEVCAFIVQRLANYLIKDRGFATNVVQSVLEPSNTVLGADHGRIKSFAYLLELLPLLTEFALEPENQDFFQANKRIENILKKNAGELADIELCTDIAAVLIEPAEKALFKFVQDFNVSGLKKEQWPEYFAHLGECSSILADFFANIMVMTDDLVLRKNRLALLNLARMKFNYLCNMSALAN